MNGKTGGVHCSDCTQFITRAVGGYCKYYKQVVYPKNIEWCRYHDVI